MDLLIKNMELPKACYDCPLIIENKEKNGFYDCILIGKVCALSTIHKDCPLVELPSHGRLGDLDALAEHIRNVYCKNCKRSKVMCKACEYGDILDEIEDAPTIIEASKEIE